MFVFFARQLKKKHIPTFSIQPGRDQENIFTPNFWARALMARVTGSVIRAKMVVIDDESEDGSIIEVAEGFGFNGVT